MAAMWVAAAAAIAGAAAQHDAASKASSSQASSAKAAQDAQNAAYWQNRTDQTPYREVGTSALARLAGGVGIQTKPLTGVSRDTTAPLLRFGSDGAPTYDPQMYANNPEYRKAWDEVAQIHAKNFDGRNYTSNSSAEWIESQIRSRLPAAQQNPNPVDPNQRALPVAGDTGAMPGSQGGNPLTRRFTLQDLQDDPVYQASYQAGLDMGNKSLQSSLAARGVLNSGGAAKALSKFATDYTSQKAGDAFNRFQVGQGNERNTLLSLAGLGQTAVNQTQQANTGYGNATAGIAMQAGQNQAEAQIAQGRMVGGTVQGIGNWWQNQNNFDRLMRERESRSPSMASGGGGGYGGGSLYGGYGYDYGQDF